MLPQSYSTQIGTQWTTMSKALLPLPQIGSPSYQDGFLALLKLAIFNDISGIDLPDSNICNFQLSICRYWYFRFPTLVCKFNKVFEILSLTAFIFIIRIQNSVTETDFFCSSLILNSASISLRFLQHPSHHETHLAVLVIENELHVDNLEFKSII